MKHLKFPITAQRVIKHAYFPSTYENLNNPESLKLKFNSSTKNFQNEIIAKIERSALLHKYEIKDSSRELIDTLFSSSFEPPITTFKHVVITYLHTPKIILNNEDTESINNIMIINMDNLKNPPKYSEEYRTAELEYRMAEIDEINKINKIRYGDLVYKMIAISSGISVLVLLVKFKL